MDVERDRMWRRFCLVWGFGKDLSPAWPKPHRSWCWSIITVTLKICLVFSRFALSPINNDGNYIRRFKLLFWQTKCTASKPCLPQHTTLTQQWDHLMRRSLINDLWYFKDIIHPGIALQHPGSGLKYWSVEYPWHFAHGYCSMDPLTVAIPRFYLMVTWGRHFCFEGTFISSVGLFLVKFAATSGTFKPGWIVAFVISDISSLFSHPSINPSIYPLWKPLILFGVEWSRSQSSLSTGESRGTPRTWLLSTTVLTYANNKSNKVTLTGMGNLRSPT